jgi:hypothetical protein
MATLALALSEVGIIWPGAGVGRTDLILAARVAADAPFDFLMARDADQLGLSRRSAPG